jgi:hypothetical protein
MLNSIIVLRIHLLELEKVNELCTDFSERYIETLRLKLNNDNIFKCDDDFLNEDGDDQLINEIDNEKEEKKCHKSSVSKASNKKLKKNNTFKSLSTSTPIKKESSILFPTEISGETSLSKIKFNMLNLSANHSLLSNETDLDDDDSSQHNYDDTYDNFDADDDLNDESENDEVFDDNNSLTRSPRSTLKSSSSSCSFINKAGYSSSNPDENFLKKSSKNKRGILPKQATVVMKKWLFQHIVVSI